MVKVIGSALIITLYFVIYGLVHSWLASFKVKNWLQQRFGRLASRGYRLAYNIFAAVTLLPMLALMALLPQQTLYVVPAPWRWLMLAGQLAALLAAGVTLLQTGLWHFLGLAQLFADKPRESAPLNLSGFYRWVRHPLYTFSLLFLWLTPVMTSNSLTAYVLFTLYFYFGSIHEERRLAAEFGEAYETYRQSVPRLIPLPGRRYLPAQSQEAAGEA